MHPDSGRKLLPAVVACLLFAGLFTSIAVLGQASSPTQGQLGALVTAAESSREYANAAVALAETHGLSVAAARAELIQGDSLLATAKADAQSGTNLAAGIAAVQSAMSAYVGAAAAASVALTNAGLATAVDYRAALAAVVEVNATVSLAASAATQACGSATGTSSNGSAFAQACAEASAEIAAARAHLSEAASMLLLARGQTTATVDLSPALTLVAQARADVNSSVAALLSVSSFSYAARAQAYIASVIDPLSADANATIRAERFLLANVTLFQTTFETQSSARSAAILNIISSAQSLATAINAVNIGGVASNITASESTCANVRSDLTALLGLPGITAFSSVVADIQAGITYTDSYASAMVSAETQSQAYSQTTLSDFSTYVSVMDSDSAAVQSTGSAYASGYQKVVADLSVLLSVPGVQAIYNNLIGLQVSATVSGVDASIQQETSAMAAVQSDYNVLSNGIFASESTILVAGSTLDAAASFAVQASAFLNATAYAAVSEISAQVQATAQAAESFEVQANATAHATVGAFASNATTLSGNVADVVAQTQTTAAANAKAVAYLDSDTQVRVSEAASGQADVSQALSFFAGQNVQSGVAAIERASLHFQAASSAGA